MNDGSKTTFERLRGGITERGTRTSAQTEDKTLTMDDLRHLGTNGEKKTSRR